MNRIKHIYRVMVAALLCMLPYQLVAQNDGVESPTHSATENLFMNPEPWSGKSYSQPRKTIDRLYATTAVGVGRLWEFDETVSKDSPGLNYHLGIGYRLSPVHGIEIGSSYNNLDLLGEYCGLDLSYVFDVTAYASRIEQAKKWQVLLKSGVEVNLMPDAKAVVGFSGAVRLQYNATPAIGVYVEPKITMFSSPNYSATTNKGSVYTSASVGMSVNIGRVVESYHLRQERFEDLDYITVPFFAIKSNVLFDMFSILNIELEVPIKNRWSVAADYVFPWWVFDNGDIDSKRNRLEVLNANLEGRYWFGDRREYDVLTGWFAGVYGGGGIYDVESDGTGYQGEFFIAAGISGGYSHKVNKKGNLRMEYSLGVGCLKSNYRKYNAIYLEDEWQALRSEEGVGTWWGPTKAKVSLSWLWRRSIKRKGGEL